MGWRVELSLYKRRALDSYSINTSVKPLIPKKRREVFDDFVEVSEFQHLLGKRQAY